MGVVRWAGTLAGGCCPPPPSDLPSDLQAGRREAGWRAEERLEERWGPFLFSSRFGVWGGTAWTVRPGIPFLPVLGCARPQRDESVCKVGCTLQMAGDHPHRPREAPNYGTLAGEPSALFSSLLSNEPAAIRGTRIGKRAAMISTYCIHHGVTKLAAGLPFSGWEWI